MRFSGWRRWFPLAIVVGMTAIVAGWITYWRRRSHVVHSVLPHPNESTSLTAIQAESSAAPIGVAVPVADPPAPTLSHTPSNDAINPIRERTHLLTWFISLAFILNLIGRILEAKQQAEFAKLITWLDIATILVLLSGSAALVVIWRKTFAWPRWLWRFSGLAAAGLLSLTAAQLSFTSDDPAVSMYQAIPLWIVAIAIALGAAWSRRAPHVPEEPPTTRWEVLLLIGVTLLALIVRLVNLADIPFSLYGDETVFAVEARAFNQWLLFRPFTTAMHGHWGLFYMILGAFMRLFGETVEGIRLHSVLFGTLTIVTTYALARLLWGRRVAIIAAALLATYHYHVHFSRSALQNTYDTLFLTLTFGLFWLGWLTQRRRPWLLGALALGLAQYFYVGGRTILLLLAVLGLFWLITDRARVKAQALNVALAIGVFAVVAVPIAYFATLRPDDYMTRYNQMLIFRNGWLEAAMQAEQASALQILWQQFSAAIHLFVDGADSLFYRGQSLLTPVMSLLAAGGLLYLVRHIKEGRAFMIVSSLGLIILTAGVLTLDPGGSGHHYVGTAPLIYIAIAVFIDWVWRVLEQHGARARPLALLGTALVIFLMIVDAYNYFGVFVPRHELVSSDVEPAMRLGAYLHALEQQPDLPDSVLCIRQPNISCRHSTVQFLAPRLTTVASDLLAPPTGNDLVVPPHEKRVLIVAGYLPDDVVLVQARFSQVTPLAHYGLNGNLLFTSFEIPASEP